MTLENLQLLPRGDQGWGTTTLPFGRITTFLLGPNGSGKTPLIKTLAYCLGHPVEIPALIRDKCRAVSLTLVTEEGRYRIERQLTSGVEVTVTDPTGANSAIGDERALSEWLLPKIGVSLRVLSGKNGDKVPPYMSLVGPAFIVDQDTGWTDAYVPFATHQFVKNQREEVVRWLLDVPARNRPVDKKAFQAAKTNRASIQEQINFKRRALEGLQRELGEDQAAGAIRRLEERRVVLATELTRAQSVLVSMSQTESVLDIRIRAATDRRDKLAYRLASIKRRKMQLLDVRVEVGAELDALEQNEIAAAAFRNLCGNQVCQFFRSPEESYGRRVLYLKDQLKDFEFSSGATARELALLQEQVTTADAAVAQAVEEKSQSLEQAEGGLTIGAIQATTSELLEIHVRIDRIERIAREREYLDVLINKELRAGEDVADLRPTGSRRKANPRLLDARQNLAATFIEWLVAMRTPNVPTDVAFDDELRLIVSGEKFTAKSPHSGSTRTRLVLAYHAAMVETSVTMRGVHPRLLVLDAPKQHELSTVDLRAFIERFYRMSAKQRHPVQLVFSATEREVVPVGRVDALWEPGFMFDEEPRFFGPPRAE